MGGPSPTRGGPHIGEAPTSSARGDDRLAEELAAELDAENLDPVSDERPAETHIGRAIPGPGVGPSGLGTLLAHFYLRRLTPIALVVGAVLRTREWLHDKSLWLDEYSITQNIVGRSFAGLLKPLDFTQGGPVGWLWAEHASIKIFGVHELTLRLIPWLASLVALVVFARVATALIGPVATPAATVLFATSPILIYYAAETKQYSSDVACALLVLLVTTYLMRHRPTLRRGLFWGISCGVLIWCSQPSILVSAACGVFLLARWLRTTAALLPLVAGGAMLAATVTADWFVTLRQLSGNAGLQLYWVSGYPPTGGTVSAYLNWFRSTANSFVEQVDHYAWPGLIGLLAAWGFASLIRRRRWSALLLGLLPLVAVGAAVARKYPLSGRLALYLLPVEIMLLTAGLMDADPVGAHRLPRVWRWVATGGSAIALILCTAGSVGTGLSKMTDPDDTTSGRQAIEFVAQHQEPGDIVLEDDWSASALEFYGPRDGVTPNGTVRFTAPTPAGCTEDPLSVLGNSRVWLVFAHLPSNEPPNRAQIYASQMTTRSTEIASYTGPGGAGAYLFDFRQIPTAPPPVLASWVAGGCFSIYR